MRGAALRLLLSTALLLAVATAANADPKRYGLVYDVRLVPTERAAHVTIRLQQQEPGLFSVLLLHDPERHFGFKADGRIDDEADGLRWTPPAAGGVLRFSARIDHLRDAKSYDARCTDAWAVFRGDDLVPAVRARTVPGARSEAELRLRLPAQWSAAVPYEKLGAGRYRLTSRERGFVRPVGWMVAARRLGVVREKVEGMQVAVAGPVGHDVRRLDVLALLRWTLPRLRAVLPLPERLLIVGAGDPMWRGGLSGPASLYLHADRPLLTPDATSPALHEIFHAVLGRPAGAGDDWIVEGLAELYSLEMLVRSGTVSRARHDKTLAKMRERGRAARSLRVDAASGAVTDRAVAVLYELDARIREATGDEASLDTVVRALAERPAPITTQRLREEAERAARTPLPRFFDRPELLKKP